MKLYISPIRAEPVGRRITWPLNCCNTCPLIYLFPPPPSHPSVPSQAIAAFATNAELQLLRVSPEESVKSKWLSRSALPSQVSQGIQISPSTALCCTD